jgi:UDP-N-acetylmuramoyl-tripeptide--D-alanyl-D-alanine ligase
MATPIPRNRAQFRREDVLTVTAGTARGPKWETAIGVVTDSRAVQAGNLFVALRGDRFDANAFAEQAAASGATAVLVESGTSLPASVSVIEVEDTLVALGNLARFHRDAWGGEVIGITGSVGKTTTKALAAAALESGGRRVLATTGNLNNRIGVPMTLFQLDDTVDTAVIEMGTSEPGEIARLAEIARPDAAIVTRASLAHTEGLGSIEAVADEKVSLLHALGPEGLAIAYGDDAPIKKRASVVPVARKLFYGRDAGNDVRVLDWEAGEKGTRAQLQVRGQVVELEMGLLGEAAVLNAAAALTLCFGLGLSLEAAARGIVDVDPVPGRMQPLAGRGDRLLIDDSYNANPASVEVALSTARAIAERRRAPLVVVLGDMKELGEHSEGAHRRVGDLVVETEPFLFIGCGDQMQLAVDAANGRGVDTLWFKDAAECGEIGDRLPLHAVVLVKGSRSMQMEGVINALREGERS